MLHEPRQSPFLKKHKKEVKSNFPFLSLSNFERAKDFTFSINTSYSEVLGMCHARHGDNWLCPQLREGKLNKENKLDSTTEHEQQNKNKQKGSVFFFFCGLMFC